MALKGESMALGARNSGTAGSNAALLSGLGIDTSKDYTLVEAGYGPSAEAMQNGQVKGASMPAGVPVATLAIGDAGAKNAALLAVAILASNRPELRKKLEAFRRQQADRVLDETLT